MGPELPPSLHESATLAMPSTERSSSKASHIENEVMELFDKFRNPLLRYSLSLGLPMHDAEEVIQEVFLALFRHLQSGRSRTNLRGWLFRVAHNLVLKRLSGNNRHRLWSSLTSEDSEKHVDVAANPEEQALANQRQARLLAVLNCMSEQDQNCLRLRAEGLRYREIAEVLGISLGSISASLARSLIRLERAYER